MSSKETSSPVVGSTRFCAIRCPVLPLSWWKRTVLRLTAEYSFTGTLTSPNEMAPLHIDLGIGPLWYHEPVNGNERTIACACSTSSYYSHPYEMHMHGIASRRPPARPGRRLVHPSGRARLGAWLVARVPRGRRPGVHDP